MTASFAFRRLPVSALFVGFVCVFFAFISAETVWGADDPSQPVATVVAVRGPVTVQSGSGEVRKIAVKYPLFLEDVIKTGVRGRLQIMFKDNTVYSLGSNTELKLKEFSWDPENQKGKIATEVKDGVFRVMGGLISKTNPKEFTAETPVATIGIRGSMYVGSYTPQTGLSVMFEGGKGITVSNATGTVLITEPGFGSLVRDWQSPVSKPRQVSEQDAGRLYQGLKVSRQGRALSRSVGKRGTLPPPSFSSKDVLVPQNGGGKVGAASLAGVTAAVEARPGQAAEVLREAIRNEDLPVDVALGAVLQGMANTDRQQFDAVLHEAIGHGLTVDKAREIVDRLKKSGGVCP